MKKKPKKFKRNAKFCFLLPDHFRTSPNTNKQIQRMNITNINTGAHTFIRYLIQFFFIFAAAAKTAWYVAQLKAPTEAAITITKVENASNYHAFLLV